jgi:hypothetical protein
MDDNSLRRASDRTESSILVALVIVFLVGAPLLGIFAGRSAYESGLRSEQTQPARQWVTARLIADSPVHVKYVDRMPAGKATAKARWTYAETVHTGQVPVKPGAKSGSMVTIAVDGTGRPVGEPRTHAETLSRAIVLGTVSVLCFGFALWTIRLVVGSVLIRRSLADWDADWSAFEPKWSGRPGA